MRKDIRDYKIDDYIFWKSYEGIKEKGSGIVVDLWDSEQGKRYLTAKNSFQTVCLSQEDLR